MTCDRNRRRFLSAAAVAVTAAPLRAVAARRPLPASANISVVWHKYMAARLAPIARSARDADESRAAMTIFKRITGHDVGGGNRRSVQVRMRGEI
jgi:hypothetical protein